MRIINTVVVFGVLVLGAAPAAADNTSCPNADYLFPGQVLEDTLSTGGFIWFKTHVAARRSYALYAWAPDRDAGEGGNDLVVSVFQNDCTSTAFNVNVNENEPLPNVDASNNVHLSIEPETTGTIRIGVSNWPLAAMPVNIVLIETTLFSPWWFAGGDYSPFIVLRNTTGQATTASVWIKDGSGTLCGSASVTLSPNGTDYRAVRSYPSCLLAGYGSVTITHDSSPGGIVANTTIIHATAGISFDEPFGPRMVWGTFMRK